jgi:hypothetical protein
MRRISLAILALSIFSSMSLAAHHHNCKPAKCEKDRVYDTLVVYSFDQVHDEPLLIPIDDERNTAEFREEGVAYLHEKWGLTEITPDQLIGGQPVGINGTPYGDADYTVQMIAMHPDIRYQVHAINSISHPELQNKIPVTNLRIDDIACLATIGDHDIPNTGSSAHLYPVLKAHSIVTLGYYFMLVKNDHGTETLVDTIQFTSQSPINVDPYGFMNIPCDLHSELFGVGLTRGGGSNNPPVPTENYQNVMITMTFPPTLSHKHPDDPATKCKNIKPCKFGDKCQDEDCNLCDCEEGDHEDEDGNTL